MKAKEFKRILKEANTFTNYEQILNMISLFYDWQGKECEDEGLMALAKANKETSIKIYEELKKTGYYEK